MKKYFMLLKKRNLFKFVAFSQYMNFIRKTKILRDCMTIFRPSCSGTNEVVALRQPRRPRGFFTRGDSTALERFSGPSMSLPNIFKNQIYWSEIQGVSE